MIDTDTIDHMNTQRHAKIIPSNLVRLIPPNIGCILFGDVKYCGHIHATARVIFDYVIIHNRTKFNYSAVKYLESVRDLHQSN